MTPIISSVLTVIACALIFASMVMLCNWIDSHNVFTLLTGKKHHIYAMNLDTGWMLCWETRKCVGSRKGIGRQFSWHEGYGKYVADFKNRDNYYAFESRLSS